MDRSCPRCGLILTPGQVICSRCGAQVAPIKNAASTAPQQPSRPAKASKKKGGCFLPILIVCAIFFLLFMVMDESSGSQGPGVSPQSRATLPPRENTVTQGASNQQASETIQEIKKAVAPYEKSSGYVDTDQVSEALDAASAAAAGDSHVLYHETSDFSLYFEASDGYGYVYTPALEEYDVGDGGLEIATFQPFYTENKRLDPQGAINHDAPDHSAAELAATRPGWSFDNRGGYDDDDINDSEVDISRILSLGDYRLTLWHGHGGYSSTPGYFVATGIEATDTVKKQYQSYFQRKMMLLTMDNRICLTEKFFDASFDSGSLDGAIIYMGTCLSGYTDSFADLLVSKGAAVVFVNSSSILRQYNLNMMEAVMTGLRDGMTVSQALSYAKAQHGETSAYTAQTEEGPVTHTAHVYYRGQEGADRLTLADFEPSVSHEALYAPIVEGWRVEYSKSFNDFCKYTLYDIDLDGSPELVVNTGTGDADSLYTVYTIRNGEAVRIGAVPAPYSTLYGMTQSGILVMSGHDFKETCHILHMDGDALTLQEQYEMPIEICYWDEVCSMEPLAFYPLHDPTGLAWRSNPGYDNWGALQLDPRGGH